MEQILPQSLQQEPTLPTLFSLQPPEVKENKFLLFVVLLLGSPRKLIHMLMEMTQEKAKCIYWYRRKLMG